MTTMRAGSPNPTNRRGRSVLLFAAATAVGLLTTALTGCSGADDDAAPATTAHETTAGETAQGAADPVSLEPTLTDSAPDGFHVGVAVGGGGHLGWASPQDDPAVADLVATQFSSVTPENAAKWEVLRPSQDTFDFGELDRIVDEAEANGQRVRGHTLLWHSQNAPWVTEGDFTPDELRALLREHVTTVVGRYAGRIADWDVANEIFDDSGVYRQENPFIAALGPQIVADVFRWAHEADPDARLFLNDFNVETPGPKVDAYLALIAELQAQDVPVHAMGLQTHLATQYGSPRHLQSVIEGFAALGVDVELTELDVRVAVARGEQPEPVDVLSQNEAYEMAAQACLAVERCTGITVWGVSDKNSWVPSVFPGEGAALLFDEDLAPKAAFGAFRDALAQGRP